MRFLVLLTDAYGSIGGIAKYNRDLLKALSAYPACSKIVVLPRLGQIRREDQAPVKICYVTSGGNSKLKYIINALKTVITARKFNLIICGHVHLIPLAVVFKYLLNCPVVLTIHGIEAWQPSKNALINYMVKKVDAFLSVSEFTTKHFCRWSGLKETKGHILPNCIDLETFRPGPKNQSLIERYRLQNKKVIFTLARLNSKERYKGIDEILEVMPDLLKEMPNLIYIIGGDGDDRRRFESKAQSLGLQEHVIFTGFLSENEKVDYYRLSDAYVMPGRGEGFGIVYLEAIACGVPVLGSQLDASAEIIDRIHYGITVRSLTKEHIKDGIMRILKEFNKRDTGNIAEYAYPCFQSKIHQFINYFSETLK